MANLSPSNGFIAHNQCAPIGRTAHRIAMLRKSFLQSSPRPNIRKVTTKRNSRVPRWSDYPIISGRNRPICPIPGLRGPPLTFLVQKVDAAGTSNSTMAAATTTTPRRIAKSSAS